MWSLCFCLKVQPRVQVPKAQSFLSAVLTAWVRALLTKKRSVTSRRTIGLRSARVTSVTCTQALLCTPHRAALWVQVIFSNIHSMELSVSSSHTHSIYWQTLFFVVFALNLIFVGDLRSPDTCSRSPLHGQRLRTTVNKSVSIFLPLLS